MSTPFIDITDDKTSIQLRKTTVETIAKLLQSVDDGILVADNKDKVIELWLL